MNEQSETTSSSVSEHWFGHDRLRLAEGGHAIDITVGSESHWDRSHLRRLRQSGDLPGMVPIIDSDFSADGKPFAVTPVVDAPTLADRVAAGDLTWEDGAAISEAAARAAHEAHLRGLFHGGLDPHDVYVIGDDVAISGVGLGLGGTPPPERLGWVAPEVRDGAEPTERSDVYSLGKVLEFSLGDSLDTVPRSIRRLIMWSSSDTPEARPPSAMEFASILAEGLGEDRRTFGPAFIPTAETSDLASRASSAVSKHTPSERAQNTATAAGAGALGVGAAAMGAAGLLGDQRHEELDEGVFDTPGAVEPDVFAQDTVEVDPGVDFDETQDATADHVAAYDAAAGAAAATVEVPTPEVEQAHSNMATPTAPAIPPAEYQVLDTSHAATQTVDLDEPYEPEKRRNRAGLVIGAILGLALVLIAWGLLSTRGDEDVAADGGAETNGAVAEDDGATATTSADAENATESDAAEGSDTNGDNTTDGDTASDEAANSPTTAATATSAEPPTTESNAATTAGEEARPEEARSEEGTSEEGAAEEATAGAGVEAADAASLVPRADGPIAASEAGIQLLHGVPGAEVDVYVNGRAIATGFEAGTIAGPIAMEPGDYEVALYPATDVPPASTADRSDEALFTQMVPVGGSAASIVAHLDTNGEVTISPFLEQLSAVDPGQGRLMIRHLMAGGDVEATVDTNVVGSLSPGEEAAVDVDAGSVDVAIVGADGTVLTSAPVNVGDGELVVLSAIGAPGRSADLVVQRYSGLATAPAAVPTGNSGLLGGGNDELGIQLSYGLMAVLALSGVAVFLRRRRTAH